MNYKYPRTFHLPFSKGASNDDKIAKDISRLFCNDIVISEKMDGGCSCIESDACYARTHSGPPTHPSFDLFKAKHASIKHKIPENLQLFGEVLYARHSIEYSELPGYFLIFNIRDLGGPGPPLWLSWGDVEMWAEEIGVPTVPVLFSGTVKNESELLKLSNKIMNEPSCCGGVREGFVIRLASDFPDDDFSSCIFKNVRANHVQTDEHWSHQQIIKNKLK